MKIETRDDKLKKLGTLNEFETRFFDKYSSEQFLNRRRILNEERTLTRKEVAEKNKRDKELLRVDLLSTERQKMTQKEIEDYEKNPRYYNKKTTTTLSKELKGKKPKAFTTNIYRPVKVKETTMDGQTIERNMKDGEYLDLMITAYEQGKIDRKNPMYNHLKAYAATIAAGEYTREQVIEFCRDTIIDDKNLTETK